MDNLPAPSDVVPLLWGAGGAAILLVAAALLERRRWSRVAIVLAAAAFVVGHLTTYVRTHAWPSWPAVQSQERGVWAVVAFGVGGVLLGLLRRDVWSRVVAAGLAGGLVYYLLEPLLVRAPDLTGHLPAKTAFLLAGVVVVLLALVEDLASRLKGPALPLALALLVGAAGQLQLLYGSGSLAQLSGTASIALVIAALPIAFLKETGLHPAAAAGFVGVVAAVGLDGYYFSETPPSTPLLVGLASPALLYLALAPGIKNLKAPLRHGIPLFLVIAVLAWAFWTASEAVPEAPDDPYGDFYEEHK